MVQTYCNVNNKPLLVIGGPTACGKTALSIALAIELNGEIISADSMQIYREMNIGTAKPTADEMSGVPHHMIGIVSCKEQFSVSDYVSLAREKISNVINRGKTPIVVGGTGLYIKALLYGYTLGGASVNAELREKYDKLADELGTPHLHELLLEKNPNRATQIHPNDRVRIIRALELFEEQNTKDNSFVQAEQNEIIEHTLYVLDGNREKMYDRINRRVDFMIQNGLVEEVEQLLLMGANSQAMQAIGYKEIVQYLQGVCSLENAIETLKRNTRNYAKRQLTWFRNMNHVQFVDCDTEFYTMRDIILTKCAESEKI